VLPSVVCASFYVFYSEDKTTCFVLLVLKIKINANVEFCKRQIESKNMSENSHMRMLRPSQHAQSRSTLKLIRRIQILSATCCYRYLCICTLNTDGLIILTWRYHFHNSC